MRTWIEVFIDEFSIVGTSFDDYLDNLKLILKHCEETNLVLNWEKCHFMVKEGTVLGHLIYGKGIGVDKDKIETIEKLLPHTSVKGIRSFPSHVGFYKSFIRDFCKISKPLSNLLMQWVPFGFDDKCMHAFATLKRKAHNYTDSSSIILGSSL